MIHDSDSVERTEAIAAELASRFVGGEVVALYGDLGAGKTQFVRGLLLGLGGDGRSVSSPTFVLLNIYASGRLKFFHLDAYRVAAAEDFEAIGFAELLEQDGVVAVEWPGKIERLLPRQRWNVSIATVDQQRRRIEIVGPDEKSSA